jgi:hypothetical protein
VSAYPPLPPPPLEPDPSSRKGLRGWKVVALGIGAAILAAVLSVVAFFPVVGSWRPVLLREPPSVQTTPLQFPENWVTIVASDGSFRLTAPGPGTMSKTENGMWALDLHDWSDASCVLYVDWAGPESDPRAYTRSRLDDWVAQMSDPHEAPTAVRAGSALGWRAQMSYEEGTYPVGSFQVVYAEGWEYSMGCGLAFTHPRSVDGLTRRFLDSFSTSG